MIRTLFLLFFLMFLPLKTALAVAGDVQLDLSAGGSIVGTAVLTGRVTDSANASYYLDPAADPSLIVAGSVGIGTTTPGYALDVNGTIRAGTSALLSTGGAAGYYQDTINGAYRSIVSAATTNGYYFQTNTGAATTMYVGLGGTYNGNVGIGTAAPGQKLQIGTVGAGVSTATPETITLGSDYSNTAGSNLKMRVYDDGASTAGMGVSAGQLEIGAWSTGKIAFYRGTTQSMIIDTSGNVGIGTSALGAKLHVNGTASYTIPTTFSGAGQNAAWTTGFTTQAMNVSILSSGSIVSGTGVYAASDERIKKNIVPISQEIVDRFFTSAHPVNFNWKETNTYDSGFIAQDLIKEGLGYLVSGMPDDKLQEETNKNGMISPAGTRFIVNYSSIIPILTTGIQQQQSKIDDLTSKLNSQQQQIDELRELINAK